MTLCNKTYGSWNMKDSTLELILTHSGSFSMKWNIGNTLEPQGTPLLVIMQKASVPAL